jgi:hypothetical protein
LEAKDMGFCVPQGTKELGWHLISSWESSTMTIQGICPPDPFFLLYLVHYEYGITLKMIHIDIPLSSLITSKSLIANVCSL